MPSDPDMVAISGHKIYGPKGVGALWLREGLELPPLIYGGGQEQGMRSGTLSPALCVGLGVAAKLMRDRAESDAAHVDALWSRAVELFANWRSEEHTSELQSLMRISYAVFCLKKKKT